MATATCKCLVEHECNTHKMKKGGEYELHPSEARRLEKDGKVEVTNWPFKTANSSSAFESRLAKLEKQKVTK